MSRLRRICDTSVDSRLGNGGAFLVDAGPNQVAARESRSARAEGSGCY
jgi:hypothetical protein